MRYLALASDYDGTLAHDARVDEGAVQALERLVASGRKLILVTGRVLPELLEIFPRIALCERVVAENGALLYTPATKEQKQLAPAPSPVFVEELQRRGVRHLSVGGTIVATREPYETVVLDVIRDLGLELRIVFNKGAVMVLPAGINKATGLKAALDELNLSPHNVVAIGDAENDHALLNFAEYGVAVANAVPMLKETADWTTKGERGAGVVEVIIDLLENDLQSETREVVRHRILLGKRDSGEEVTFYPARRNLLLAGTSGSGKSTLATGILERLGQQGYQFCVIDPEGDYEGFPEAIVLGTVRARSRGQRNSHGIRQAGKQRGRQSHRHSFARSPSHFSWDCCPVCRNFEPRPAGRIGYWWMRRTICFQPNGTLPPLFWRRRCPAWCM